MHDLAALKNQVIFEEKPTPSGKAIGLARLNQPNTLNALSLNMVNRLNVQLGQWQQDDQIACVFLHGSGDRAFCAGGDVQALYQSAVANPGEPAAVAEEFFRLEYQLDYRLHSYPKPVICWGDGIVMGGGLGLFAGCRHGVVTEKTMMAMPEITIGLYPDVGGSWFLNRMPGQLGLFLALTGARINAQDCLYSGLAEYGIDSNQYDSVLSALGELAWTDCSEANHRLVQQRLTEFSACSTMPEGQLAAHQAQIDALCKADDAISVIDAILSLETDQSWLIKARENLTGGSPVSARVIYRQIRQSKGSSLADVFRSEIQLSTHMVRYPDFAEGVRALLIDKDRSPKWQYQSAGEVPESLLEQMFSAPSCGSTWPQNPLEHL